MDKKQGESNTISNKIDQAIMTQPKDNNVDMMAVVLAGIMENSHEKIEVIKQFLSAEKFKTEITDSQRSLLPTMSYLAAVPFKSSIEHHVKRLYILKEQGIKINGKLITDQYIEESGKQLSDQLTLDILNNFITQFLELGIAVKRSGRKEDMEAIASMMSEVQQIGRMMQNNRGNNGGFL